ncbi:OLC1v1016729C1 [Oldenlandia corymbosa var. corymbosa]|uniref:OLC1v1016729C1 n=1 Tax=Oldenlandia corymbosa var. corymbosa TaxID=529605 RepID=A0AAV1E7T5_OLDCO|nr:OLC1v1016729C1 [Oldenlandia corymbosa var. corymbosa]
MIQIRQAFKGSLVKCPCKTTPLTEQQLKDLLRMADKDGDGSFSKDELVNAFRDMGSFFPGWRARQALQFADRNGDGQISLEEFNQLVAYVRKLNYKNACPGSKSA